MYNSILTQQGTVISFTPVQHVKNLESQTSDSKEVFHLFDAAIAGWFNEEIVETEVTKPNTELWT